MFACTAVSCIKHPVQFLNHLSGILKLERGTGKHQAVCHGASSVHIGHIAASKIFAMYMGILMAQRLCCGHLCYKNSVAGEPAAAIPSAGVHQAQLGPMIPPPPIENPNLDFNQVQVCDAQHSEPQTQSSQCVVHSSTCNLA